MKVHNCYTVKWKSGCVTALNSMNSVFWRAVAEGGAWAKYIALYDERGGVQIRPSTLRFVNSYPERGGNMRAVYSAVFECPQGEKYVKVAMLYSEDGESAVSEAQINYVSTGEPPEITAVIYLDFGHDEYSQLCEGDNEIVRMLLGCATGKKLTMAYGTCSYPARICMRTSDLRTDLSQAQITYGDDFISFQSAESTAGNEILINADGVPVVRAVRPYQYEVANVSGKVTRYAFYAGNCPSEIYNVYADGNPVTRLESFRAVENIVPVKSNQSGMYLGVEGALKSDPAEEYLAVIAASYVEVYKVDVIDIALKFRVPRDGEYVEMCRGGALVMWGENVITVHEPDDNGAYTSFSYNIPRGSDRIVIREGYKYHAGYLTGTAFCRMSFSRTSAPAVIDMITVDTTKFVLARCGDAMLYSSGALNVTLSDNAVTGEFLTAKLTGVKGPLVGHGNYYVLGKSNGDTMAYNCAYNNQLLTGDNYAANGRVVYNGTYIYVYDFYWAFRRMPTAKYLSGITCACLAGHGLFVIRDGRLYVYYVNSKDMAVRIPVSYNNKQYTATVRQRSYLGLNKGARFVLKSD